MPFVFDPQDGQDGQPPPPPPGPPAPPPTVPPPPSVPPPSGLAPLPRPEDWPGGNITQAIIHQLVEEGYALSDVSAWATAVNAYLFERDHPQPPPPPPIPGGPTPGGGTGNLTLDDFIASNSKEVQAENVRLPTTAWGDLRDTLVHDLPYVGTHVRNTGRDLKSVVASDLWTRRFA